ncbi:hypothetical protein [Microbacterium sp. MPKO10]|uniref:hypothetical protein n=1 Tax=Microbacterium sp. MPKO10 TaxID=2989818 RepID=UPI002235DCC4|nr:hypothetical protein [Microbacterium sp. MPKO10]MCW4456797.1 hypothetical protein [Microbacterium sp. MPKO10]
MSTSAREATSPPRPRWWHYVANLAIRAVRVELRIYESLGRAIARRPAIAAGARGFLYHRPVLTILIIFIVISAIEIPVVDAIVHRWLPVRIGFLILGIWGVTWMIGLLCAYFMRPHTVGPDGIRVREGLELDIPVAWSDIASVEILHTTQDEDKRRVFDEGDEWVCAVRIGHDTNLQIEFERPLEIRLPGLEPRGGIHTVTKLRFWADDPRGLIAEGRKHINASDAPSPSARPDRP